MGVERPDLFRRLRMTKARSLSQTGVRVHFSKLYSVPAGACSASRRSDLRRPVTPSMSPFLPALRVLFEHDQRGYDVPLRLTNQRQSTGPGNDASVSVLRGKRPGHAFCSSRTGFEGSPEPSPMGLAEFMGDNQVERLPDGLIDGIAEHGRRTAAPVSNDASSVGEHYDFIFHGSPSSGLDARNRAIRVRASDR